MVADERGLPSHDQTMNIGFDNDCAELRAMLDALTPEPTFEERIDSRQRKRHASIGRKMEQVDRFAAAQETGNLLVLWGTIVIERVEIIRP